MSFPAQKKLKTPVSQQASQPQFVGRSRTLHDPAIFEWPMDRQFASKTEATAVRKAQRAERSKSRGCWKRRREEGNEGCLEIYYIQGHKSAKWLAMPSAIPADHCGTTNFPAQRKRIKCERVRPGAIRYKLYLGKTSAHMMINLRTPIGTAICVEDRSYRSEEITEGWEE